MRGTLNKIEPTYTREIPPEGAIQIGHTPQGKPVYKMTLVRGVNEPKIDPATGEQEYRKHPTTAEPLIGRRQLRRVEIEKIFTLEQDGMNNLYMLDYKFPTPEEIAAQERQRAIDAAVPELATALIDAGLTPAELVEAIRRGTATPLQAVTAQQQPQQSPVAPAEPAADEDEDLFDYSEFPKQLSAKKWQLSDGNTVTGTEAQAREAEGSVQLARDIALQQRAEAAEAAAAQSLIPES